METWYKEGLNFKCTGCGKCCTGFPGVVWVSDEEQKRIAALLNLDLETFLKKYTRRIGDRISLKELPRTYDCVFLQGKKCTIYEERPKQCRTFPWWPDNLHSKENWEQTAALCEGINHPEANVVAFEDIQRQLHE